MGRLALYANTLRHLKPVQLVHLPLLRLGRRSTALRPVHVAAAQEGALARFADALRSCGAPEGCVQRADDVLAGRFTFINQSVPIAELNWQNTATPLWTYHLHYCDYVLDLAWAAVLTGDARYRDAAVQLMREYARTRCHGVALAAYPMSRRIVNWLYAVALLRDVIAPDARAEILTSVAAQSGLLQGRLERDLLGNHYLQNLKALGVSAAAQNGRQNAQLRVDGYFAELRKQIAGDGLHEERSAMYHAGILQDSVELLAIAEQSELTTPSFVRPLLAQMCSALGVLTRPDGSFHQFNDCAQNDAPSTASVIATAETLGIAAPLRADVVQLPQSHFYGFHDRAAGDELLVDCGAPAPAHQPGHAHCGALSFELALGGVQIVADSGVNGYDGDELRAYSRSTRAHSTISIGGREQSEMWGTFRVARRARTTVQSFNAPFDLVAECAPYHQRGVHSRRIVRSGRAVEITDSVRGALGETILSWVQLAAGIEARRLMPHVFELYSNAQRIAQLSVTHADEVRIVAGWRMPEFGRVLPAQTIEIEVTANDGRAFGYRITP